MASMTRVSRRKMNMPSPNATASTGNRNQSSVNRSMKKSMPMARNSSPHSIRMMATPAVSAADNAVTRKFRHEFANNAG